jgi:imidazolonepropionase-like amidohydrolase
LREEHIHPSLDRCQAGIRHSGGCVDAHVHLQEACFLDAIVGASVVAIRDAGMRSNFLRGNHLIDQKCGLPLIVSARWALYKKNGYGSSLGLPVETKEQIKSEIHILKQAGAGIIKIMASGMVSLKGPGRVTAGGFNKVELQFIVQTAAACGLGVMAHANGERAIMDAAEAGVRSIEHGFFMSERALEVMAKKSTFWVPTVGALKRAAFSGSASKDVQDFVDGLICSHLEMIQHAHRIGTPLAIGTDCVLPDSRYAEAYAAELAYFEQAGVPHYDVRKIACEGGAMLLGISP